MPLLQLRNIRKRFGAIEALRGVDLAIERGEAIGLVGDNGAGKSTLFNVIAGVHAPDGGEMVLDGGAVHFRDPIEARAAGIEIVYQDLALCGNLDASLNIFLGREMTHGLGPFRFIRRRPMRRRAEELIRQLDVEVPVGEPVRTMSGGQRQAVAIARALLGDARIVLFDEPTAAISISAVEQVLKLIRRLKEQGRTVVIISHRLSDIFETCDRVAIMRHGQHIASLRIAETSSEEVSALMTAAASGAGHGEAAKLAGQASSASM